MNRKLIAAIAAVVLIVVALAGIKISQINKMIASGKAYVPPPESITSFVARVEHWPDTLDAIGSVSAVQGVNVTTEIAGNVSEIAFDSGAVVAKGDLLVRLDTSSEEAQLRALEAQVDLARINAERDRKLRAENTVSQAELDSAEMTLKQSEANADTVRAVIAKKTIRAPFAGKLGIRLVNLGQYLDSGKPVVSLQSLSPVYVDFTLPQQELGHLRIGLPVRVSTDTYPDRQFDGKLTAANPDLDASTRSIRLQATIDNPDKALRPGMFGRVQVVLESEQKVLVIPATSVLSAPYGDSVYVIETQPATNNAAAGLLARQQFIRTGRSRGDFVSVLTGLKPGDRVASSGLFKLRNGIAVAENNSLEPAASETPKPPEK